MVESVLNSKSVQGSLGDLVGWSGESNSISGKGDGAQSCRPRVESACRKQIAHGTADIVLHVDHFLERTLLQEWKESLSRPVHTHDVDIHAVLKVFPSIMQLETLSLANTT
jgi:cytosine/adenosine deaminase-related metal-dependent hydrolase